MSVFEKLARPAQPDPLSALHAVLDINADAIARRMETSARTYQQMILQRMQTLQQAVGAAQAIPKAISVYDAEISVGAIEFPQVDQVDELAKTCLDLRTRCDEAAYKLADMIKTKVEEKNAAAELCEQADAELYASIALREKAYQQADEIYQYLVQRLARAAEADEEARIQAEKAAAEAEALAAAEEQKKRAQLERERQEKKAKENEEKSRLATEKAAILAEERTRAAEERYKKAEALKAKLEYEKQSKEAYRLAKLEEVRKERERREQELAAKRNALLSGEAPRNYYPTLTSVGTADGIVSAQFSNKVVTQEQCSVEEDGAPIFYQDLELEAGQDYVYEEVQNDVYTSQHEAPCDERQEEYPREKATRNDDAPVVQDADADYQQSSAEYHDSDPAGQQADASAEDAAAEQLRLEEERRQEKLRQIEARIARRAKADALRTAQE